MTDVDYVINVFERSYREVLKPGSLRARSAEHCYPFRRIVVLVNNVDDREHVSAMLEALLASGEITEAHFVCDWLDHALSVTNLSRDEIRSSIHYTDCSLVAVVLAGSPYLLYSDADVHLTEPADWISPSLELMHTDHRVAVANPEWTPSTLHQETRERSGDFALGYGFSDQLYLLRRDEFARPIYKHSALVSWRYPLCHRAPVFEQRVDAYMRCFRRLRATSTRVAYRHTGDEGAGYSNMAQFDRWRRRFMHGVMWLASKMPGEDPRYHI
jgi:hypothetical protein